MNKVVSLSTAAAVAVFLDGPRPVFGGVGTRDVDIAEAQRSWDAGQAAKVSGAFEFLPVEATEGMCDAVRNLLNAMEEPGRSFGSVRRACSMSGSIANWPKWALETPDAAHFTQWASAGLIWALMQAEAVASRSLDLAPQPGRGE